MWIEKIHDFMKNNKNTIDLSIFYHQSYYVSEILSGVINFKINKLKNNKTSLQITKKMEENSVVIKKEDFINWWYFERYSQLIEEEKNIFLNFNTQKSEIYKQINAIKDKDISEDDTDEMKVSKEKENQELAQKRNTLLSSIKEMADISNRDIEILRKFRAMFGNLNDIDEFMKCLIYIS